MDFIPLNGWMVVDVDKDELLTESGLLYKPTEYSEHMLRRGTVLLVSDINVRRKKKDGTFSHRSEPAPIPPGSRVLFPALYVSKIYYIQFREKFGSRYALLKPEDILLYETPDAGEGKGLDDVKLGWCKGVDQSEILTMGGHNEDSN